MTGRKNVVCKSDGKTVSKSEVRRYALNRSNFQQGLGIGLQTRNEE